MSELDKVFAGSIPKLYESLLVPLIFQPFATDLVARLESRPLSRVLEIAFSDGQRFKLPYEFLRVYSPSAEVRGHGPGQEVLQLGKKNIEITQIDPVGAYAVQPVFSDGHDTGIYSWVYLREIDKPEFAIPPEAPSVEREPKGTKA